MPESTHKVVARHNRRLRRAARKAAQAGACTCKNCGRHFSSELTFNEHAGKFPKPIQGESFADYSTRVDGYVCPEA